MSQVCVSPPTYTQEDGYTLVSAEIAVGTERHALWYRTSAPVACGVEPFLVASLFAAMRTGLPLYTDQPVSPVLLANLQQIQEIFHAWDSELTIISVQAPVKQGQVSRALGIGCFFSGGIDSFYSALKHAGEINALIFIHGFDIPLRETALRSRVREALHTAASQLNVQLLEVETNLRSLSDRYLHWGFSHGAALASVALLLSGQMRRVYVPSTYPYADLFPWGSHPLVDPLWSTEFLSVVHDGCEATRVAKIARIVPCEAALRHLRVCWDNPEGKYNCGRCEKCLRTMIGLRLAGALDRCTTFDRSLNLREVAHMRIRTFGARKYAEENLRALDQTGCNPDLAQALRDCLHNQVSYQAAEDQWEQDIPIAKNELAPFIAEGECLILVDEDLLGSELIQDRRVLPFTERDGRYWGPALDDATAIAECERLRRAGARFLVVAWPAFWWLDHYTGWNQHLRSRYPCLLQNTRLVVFDLSGQPASPPSGSELSTVAEA